MREKLDSITTKVLKEITPKDLKVLMSIFNTIPRFNYTSTQWKVAEIVIIPKAGNIK